MGKKKKKLWKGSSISSSAKLDTNALKSKKSLYTLAENTIQDGKSESHWHMDDLMLSLLAGFKRPQVHHILYWQHYKDREQTSDSYWSETVEKVRRHCLMLQKERSWELFLESFVPCLQWWLH